MKTKITHAGQPCRKCNTPVERKEHPPDFQPKPSQAYWFAWWFACPQCKTLYMVEEAKRNIRDAELQEKLDWIYKRYGTLGAFFDAVHQENARRMIGLPKEN